MTVKHTPGPWDYFVGNADGRGLVRVEAGNESVVAGQHIASMPRNDESEANARLIAAAPEMLEQLKWLCEQMKAEQDAGVSGFEDWMTPALAAIARAEGTA